MKTLGHPESRATTPLVFDCDGHVAEPRDLWQRYIADAELCARAKATMSIEDYPEGGSGFVVGGRCLLKGVEAVTFAGRPPAEFLGKHWDDGCPGAFDPVARLADMDREGITKAMVFPSFLGVLGGVEDGLLAAAMARAYNRWIHDYCATDRKRLYGVAVVPLQA